MPAFQHIFENPSVGDVSPAFSGRDISGSGSRENSIQMLAQGFKQVEAGTWSFVLRLQYAVPISGEEPHWDDWSTLNNNARISNYAPGALYRFQVQSFSNNANNSDTNIVARAVA